MKNLTTAVAVLALLGSAARADERPVAWEARGGVSYVTSNDFQGAGVSATLLRPWRNVAAGFTFDAAVAGASGTENFGFPGSSVDKEYRFSFLSMLAGVVGQLRVHAGPAVPYVELMLGVADAVEIETENTQCDYGFGPAAGAGGGLTVEINRQMAVGARGSARVLAGSLGCTDVGGLKSFRTVFLLTAGATFDVRF